MFQVSKRSWLITAGLVLGAAALAPKSFAGGPRLVAQIDEPFEVNGQLFPAGKLSLREVSSYTPVSTLNELQVDGRCLGMVLAQEIEGSLDASDDQMIFERRGADGHLVLVSMALRGQPTRRLHSLSERAGRAPWVAAAPQNDDPALLLASQH